MSNTITASCSYEVKAMTAEVMTYETRCPYPRCNRILFKGILSVGSKIEMQCPKCKNMTVLQVVPAS